MSDANADDVHVVECRCLPMNMKSRSNNTNIMPRRHSSSFFVLASAAVAALAFLVGVAMEWSSSSLGDGARIATTGGKVVPLLVNAFSLSSVTVVQRQQQKVGGAAVAAGIVAVQHHGQRKRSRSLLRDYDLIVADSGGGRFVHRRHHAQRIVLHARNYGGNSDDDGDFIDNSSSIPDPDDYDFSNNNNFNDENDDDEEEEDGLTALANKKLGISLSSYLPSLTSPDNLSSLQSEAKSLVNTAFDTRLSELSDLQSSLTQSAMEGNVRRQETSKLNAIYENQKLMEKIDVLTSSFLEKNQEEREGTIRAANADEQMGRSGRGVTWGSWGSAYLAGCEGEVIVDGSSAGGSGRGSSGGSLLLGGVDATMRRRMSVSGGGGDDDDDGGDDYASSSSAGVVENRVLIVMDDKKVREEESR